MRAWVFGDDVNTDLIIPGRYNVTTDSDRLGKAVFIEHHPNFNKNVKPGDVIVAGRNFGCGSSREHAPIAIKASGVSVIVAESFSRIFLRNAINLGLPVMVCTDTSDIEDGDELNITLLTGLIENKTRDRVLRAQPLPAFIQRIVARGGLINFLRSEGYD